jgi:hypothetical protein
VAESWTDQFLTLTKDLEDCCFLDFNCLNAAMAQAARMAREIKMLLEDPPPGVAAFPVDNRIDKLAAQIQVRSNFCLS